jgi:hypothetical protein
LWLHHLQAKGDGGGGGKDLVRGPAQAPFTAMRITGELTRSASIAQLVGLFTEHRAELNEIHLATTVTRAAKQQHGGRTTPEARAPISSVIRDATPRLPQFKARELASAAYALASVGEFDAPFFEALAAEARHTAKLSGFDCQALVNTAYAFGRLAKRLGRGDQPPYLQPLLAAIMEAGRPRLGDFNPQDISNTLLALAWAGVYDAGFVEAAIDASRKQLPQLKPQELANVAWALQQLRHRDEGFMRQLLQQAVENQDRLGNSQNISNTVYAAALLVAWGGVEGLGQLGASLAATSPSSFNAQDIANLALAHAVMGLREPWLVGLVAGAAAQGVFIRVNEVQLHLYAQALAAQPGGVPPQLQPFTGQWAAAFTASHRGPGLVPFAATVLATLQRMGLDAAAQPGSLYAMTNRQQGGRVVTVVGVDGGGLTRTLPHTLMGTRLLIMRLAASAKSSAGAVAVTEPDWEALGGDAGAQEALLRARLAHLVPPPTPPPPPPLSAAAVAHLAQLRREQQAVARGPSSGSGLTGSASSPAPSKPQARPRAAPQPSGPSAQERKELREQLERDSREAAAALMPPLSPAQPSPQAVGPRRPASRPRPSAPPTPGNAAAA